ncbi:MAG: mucoidy inhibitor MuiA family protein [Bacteriovoracaceae bacterium]|nr:mucoidy inhibitor MuiA family protein [Bacteriovoracaceae bacterium]
MKFLLLFFLLLSTVSAKSIDSKNKISEVTVFKDRAFVTRSMNKPIKKGAHTIVFFPVTTKLDRDSLKVTSGGRNVKILGINTKLVHYRDSISPEVNKIIETQAKLRNQKSKLMNKVQGLLKQNRDLLSLSKHYQQSFSLNLHNQKWSAANLKSFINFLDQRNVKMKGTWKESLKKYITLVEKIEFWENKKKELHSKLKKSQLKVLVETEVLEESNIKLKLSYLVRDCTWTPVYDFRINSKNKSANVEQHAMVYQNSGEDWKNVRLTLSNKRSEIKPKVPYLSSYTLSFKKVEKVKTVVTGTQTNDESLNQASRSVYDETNKTKFVIKSRQTILEHMPKVKIKLDSKETTYKEWKELVAAQFPKVYKKGELVNPYSYSLPQGQASIYYNGDFIQNFFKSKTQKGETFNINAGLDYDITVKRSYHNETKKSGLLDGEKTYKRKFWTNLKNYSSNTKKLRVYEQVPESELDAVKIEFTAKNKSFKKDKDRPSWVYWDVSLPSRQLKTLEHKISITTPKDFQFNW